jgi:hypothetical protein
MKDLRKLFGVFFVAATIACTMAACDIFGGGDKDETPVASDYEIGNLTQTTGSTIAAVTITPKAGKSSGARTIYYEGIGGTTYAKNTALPPATATNANYAVTFDVAAASGWKEAKGLFAGVLAFGVNQTPVAGDYDIIGLFQSVDTITPTPRTVEVRPKEGKSTGARTTYYEGLGNTSYNKSTIGPSGAGTYNVTFDVAAATGWNAAAGLAAGTLDINNLKTPVVGDYNISNLFQIENSVVAVKVEKKDDTKSSGKVDVYYTGSGGTSYAKSNIIPQKAGKYAVTFDVAAVAGVWNPAAGLMAGYLEVTSSAQTITVTIVGEPAVGNELTAVVLKNFQAELAYQWWVDDVPQYEDYWPNADTFYPHYQFTGKKISVKVKYGDGANDYAVSPSVTIKPLEYKLLPSEQYGPAMLEVRYKSGKDWQPAWFSDISIQWIINDATTSFTGWLYDLMPGDAPKSYKAKVTYNSITAFTDVISTKAPPAALAGIWETDEFSDFRGGDWYGGRDIVVDDYNCMTKYTLWFLTDSIYRMQVYYEETDTGNDYWYADAASQNYTYTASTNKVTLTLDETTKTSGTIGVGGSTLTISVDSDTVVFNKKPLP